MKKYLLLSISIILSLSLVGCFFKNEEKELEDVTIEKEEIQNATLDEEKKDSDVWDVTSERPEEYAEPDDLDEPLGDYGDQDNPIIAVFTNLWELENLPEDVSLGILRADMDAYLRYCFPNIDEQYNVSVVKGSEKDDPVRYEFKVIVEAINPDGSDLSIKCRWYHLSKGETGHYDFFSDITPEGTRTLTDENGNPIDWDAPLTNPFK